MTSHHRRARASVGVALRRFTSLSLLLLGIDFLDEFTSGVPSVGAPDIQHSFDLTYARVAFALFVLPQLLSLLLEPPLFLLADRYRRKWFVCGGLIAMALCDFLSGLAPSFAVLMLALAISGPASGCGVTIAQATLMDANPDQREKLMTRWTLMGALGDLATPALFAALAALQLGWRAAFLFMGAILLLYAIVLARRTFPDARSAEKTEREPTLREALGAALRNKQLLVWLFGVWLCGLLDELLVAFGALYLRDQLGADTATRSAILGCFMLGSLLGLLLTDRLLARFRPVPLITISAATCLAAYVAWLAAPGPIWSGALMLCVGTATAPLYPIAKARAYRALPGQSGMVNALGHIFGPATLALPLFLGFVADQFGLVTALLILAAQPAGLLLIGLTARETE